MITIGMAMGALTTKTIGSLIRRHSPTGPTPPTPILGLIIEVAPLSFQNDLRSVQPIIAGFTLEKKAMFQEILQQGCKEFCLA